MNFIIVVILYLLLTAWITGFIVIFRAHLSSMAGMMAAMALGMGIGLAMGSLLALWLPGQFFHSTLIGMIMGGSVGIIVGWPSSLLAVIDGLLSGVMGGMMGTMLMVMMPSFHLAISVKFIAILSFGTIFLVFMMLHGEIKPDVMRGQSFLLSRPIAMFIVIILSYIYIHLKLI